MPDPEDELQRRFWKVDPSIFETRKARNRFERLLEVFGTVSRFISVPLLLGYPLVLVIVGLVYGGLAFWGFFSGSIAVMGLLIWRSGYARNFAAWNPSLGRQLLGLSLGFLIAAGLYLGLVELQLPMLAIMFGLLGLGLLYVIRKER